MSAEMRNYTSTFIIILTGLHCYTNITYIFMPHTINQMCKMSGMVFLQAKWPLIINIRAINYMWSISVHWNFNARSKLSVNTTDTKYIKHSGKHYKTNIFVSYNRKFNMISNSYHNSCTCWCHKLSILIHNNLTTVLTDMFMIDLDKEKVLNNNVSEQANWFHCVLSKQSVKIQSLCFWQTSRYTCNYICTV